MKDIRDLPHLELKRTGYGTGGLGFQRLASSNDMAEKDSTFIASLDTESANDETQGEEDSKKEIVQDVKKFAKKFIPFREADDSESSLRSNAEGTIGNSPEKTKRILDIIDAIPMPRSFSGFLGPLVKPMIESNIKDRLERRRREEEIAPEMLNYSR